MDEMLARLWESLTARVIGPMSFRLILQPAMAAFLAIRAGMQDAASGRPLYGWAIATDPVHRRDLLHDGWKAIAKVFILALVLDVVYQIMVQRWVYPLEAVLVAALLACVPYLLVRGPANRLMRLARPVPRKTT
jgi:hypothetical protein